MAKSAKKKQQGGKRAPTQNESNDGEDWMASLVKQSTSSNQPSKAERIERRKAKKQRRDDRTAEKNPHRQEQRASQEERMEQRGESDRQSTRENLRNLSKFIENCVGDYQMNKRSDRYQSSEPKGKATALAKKNKLNEDTVQPRRRDYGGLGIARPSMWMELNNPSFVPLLQEEFSEHVPGFFGKQRTKAMKKQLDGNMLWRQLAEKRVDKKKLKQSGMSEAKLDAMAPDERIEAMIRAGLVWSRADGWIEVISLFTQYVRLRAGTLRIIFIASKTPIFWLLGKQDCEGKRFDKMQ